MHAQLPRTLEKNQLPVPSNLQPRQASRALRKRHSANLKVTEPLGSNSSTPTPQAFVKPLVSHKSRNSSLGVYFHTTRAITARGHVRLRLHYVQISTAVHYKLKHPLLGAPNIRPSGLQAALDRLDFFENRPHQLGLISIRP